MQDSKLIWNFCRVHVLHPNALEVETREFLEPISSEAARFLEPQLPPKVASHKPALLA
jgi:hypothetical protein